MIPRTRIRLWGSFDKAILSKIEDFSTGVNLFFLMSVSHQAVTLGSTAGQVCSFPVGPG